MLTRREANRLIQELINSNMYDTDTCQKLEELTHIICGTEDFELCGTERNVEDFTTRTECKGCPYLNERWEEGTE